MGVNPPRERCDCLEISARDAPPRRMMRKAVARLVCLMEAGLLP